jgi:hypothetical protein
MLLRLAMVRQTLKSIGVVKENQSSRSLGRQPVHHIVLKNYVFDTVFYS